MWPNPQIPADLVPFTEEILNRKLHLLVLWLQHSHINRLKKDIQKENLNHLSFVNLTVLSVYETKRFHN